MAVNFYWEPGLILITDYRITDPRLIWWSLTKTIYLPGWFQRPRQWSEGYCRLCHTFVQKAFILLMDEILHRLEYKKPGNNGIFAISTGAGFLPSTVWVFPFQHPRLVSNPVPSTWLSPRVGCAQCCAADSWSCSRRGCWNLRSLWVVVVRWFVKRWFAFCWWGWSCFPEWALMRRIRPWFWAEKKTPDTKVLAEVCRWALALALLQEVQWCYLHCRGLVLRVSMQGQRIHEKDGCAWKIDEIQWSNPHVTISTGIVGSRIWALSESPFNAQVLGDPGWQGHSQVFWKCLSYFTPIQSNKKSIQVFFAFQPMINFSTSSTFRARVSLKDGNPTYQHAGADPTLWTHLTFSFCDSRHELFPNSFILAPWKGSAQISVWMDLERKPFCCTVDVSQSNQQLYVQWNDAVHFLIYGKLDMLRSAARSMLRGEGLAWTYKTSN